MDNTGDGVEDSQPTSVSVEVKEDDPPLIVAD